MVQFDLGTTPRPVDDHSALALLARLENRESDIAVEIARSLSRALVRGASTDIVLDESDQAELRSVLEDWSSEGELSDEFRWLHMALHGERLPRRGGRRDGRGPSVGVTRLAAARSALGARRAVV
jgi:hypothetical protein